jgi:hypothetical protein
VRAVVDPGDLDAHADFWSTPLGRLLFAAGGFKHEFISQVTAAAVLRLSRQRIHQLLAQGQLRHVTDAIGYRVIRAEDARALLKSKLDEDVKTL